MQDSRSQKINERFFEAIDLLIDNGTLKGKKSFSTLYDLNWGNFYRLRKEPQREFQLSYLSRLVEDFGVSSEWLLTGRGNPLEAR